MTSRGSKFFEIIGTTSARFALDGMGGATATAALSALNTARKVRLDRIIMGSTMSAVQAITLTIPLSTGNVTLVIEVDSANGSHRQRDLFIELGDGTEGSANFSITKSVDFGGGQDGVVVTYTEIN